MPRYRALRLIAYILQVVGFLIIIGAVASAIISILAYRDIQLPDTDAGRAVAGYARFFLAFGAIIAGSMLLYGFFMIALGQMGLALVDIADGTWQTAKNTARTVTFFEHIAGAGRPVSR